LNLEPLFWTSRNNPVTSGSSFILDLYAHLSLDYAQFQITSELQATSKHFQISQNPQNTSEILGHKYEVLGAATS